jgi:hypothetical protein
MPVNTRSHSHNLSPTPELHPGPEIEPENSVEDSVRHDSATPPDAPNLAEAITLMTETFRRREDTPRSAIKIKVPDTFDGSEPRKLNNFILLCNLFFRNNPYYSDDEPKVTFALSYLRGTALEYFEPAILDPDEIPPWIDDWPAFLRVLRTQFGPLDPTADAEDGIDNLRMQEDERILKYNVDFNRLAIQTGWNDGVLRHRYYSGLAERIKDIMGQQGKPATLDAMRFLAHSIDSRYWERHREKSRSDKNDPDESDEPDRKSDNNPKSNKNSGNSTSGNSNPDNSEKNDKDNSNNNKSFPAISDKLGKDGKLTPHERQRRFDNNLCLFCGAVGHMARDCPRSTSSASKARGRAAQAKEKEKESPDSNGV